jgi:hypothetical protein
MGAVPVFQHELPYRASHVPDGAVSGAGETA